MHCKHIIFIIAIFAISQFAAAQQIPVAQSEEGPMTTGTGEFGYLLAISGLISALLLGLFYSLRKHKAANFLYIALFVLGAAYVPFLIAVLFAALLLFKREFVAAIKSKIPIFLALLIAANVPGIGTIYQGELCSATLEANNNDSPTCYSSFTLTPGLWIFGKHDRIFGGPAAISQEIPVAQMLSGPYAGFLVLSIIYWYIIAYAADLGLKLIRKRNKALNE